MNPKLSEDLGPLSIVAIDIGNSQTKIAQWNDGELYDRGSVPTGNITAVEELLDSVRGKCANQERQAIVIGSVVPSARQSLTSYVEEHLNLRAFIVGEDPPLPMDVAVGEPNLVGVDRVCSAAAAFERIQQACVIVSVGSAVTIDCVDEDGVFRGGAILPGAVLQAKALAGGTAQLPLVEMDDYVGVIGTDTRSAIAAGIRLGLAGAIRGIVEAIATELGHWPQTILTGGGVPLIQDGLEFADNYVADLCLMGVGLAFSRRVATAAEQ